MNILDIQEALKDFSEQQLIKEMQNPSGNAPQFLVLSELNRRKRMKADFQARQAQQAPTVAEASGCFCWCTHTRDDADERTDGSVYRHGAELRRYGYEKGFGLHHDFASDRYFDRQ